MPNQREQSWERIANDGAFDVVIVGGGINGIGALRDLSLQGLSVLLVEANDFCSGCSSAPSRMIHGGLRYLENGEIHLVQESLRERDALLANAPHMVRPLATTIPIAKLVSGIGNAAISFLGLSGKPHPRGALPVKIGLWLYDWITAKNRRLPPHVFRSASETARLWPQLRRDLKYSATYYDAWISHPERLGIELIRDSLADNPNAIALNYMHLSADGATLTLADKETGRTLPVTAKVLVNATGAWVDETIEAFAGSHTRLVEGTKGSHLVIEHKELMAALGGNMIYFENGDGRVCIVFPYLGRVLAGATDIRVKEAGRTACGDDERDYILSSLRSLFPRLDIGESQIVYTYSGIRPLPVSDADFTGRISRAHFVRRIDGPVPQFCMVGGKWTTFRAFAEQTTDAVLAALGHSRKASTHDLPIGGGKGYMPDLATGLAARNSISTERAAHLVDLYGAAAQTVFDFCGTVRDAPLPDLVMSEGEIRHAVRFEAARHLSDVLQRRSPLAIRGTLSMAVIEAAAAVMAEELGWSEGRTEEEIKLFVGELERFHRVTPANLEGMTHDKD